MRIMYVCMHVCNRAPASSYHSLSLWLSHPALSLICDDVAKTSERRVVDLSKAKQSSAVGQRQRRHSNNLICTIIDALTEGGKIKQQQQQQHVKFRP